MYSFFAKIVKFITFLLRLLQIAGIVYMVAFVVYWFAQIMKFQWQYNMSEYFAPVYPYTEQIMAQINYEYPKETMVFHPETFASIIIIFQILLTFNFLFVWIGSVEKFFVEKSYEKDEHKY